MRVVDEISQELFTILFTFGSLKLLPSELVFKFLFDKDSLTGTFSAKVLIESLLCEYTI